MGIKKLMEMRIPRYSGLNGEMPTNTVKNWSSDMGKLDLHRRVIEYFPHLGHNILTFYIFIRMFQWTIIFFSDSPREVFFNIDPEIYMGILHLVSLMVGLFLIFKVCWSPLLAQLYQLFLVAHPIFLPSIMSALIAAVLIHGLWIFYFSFSPMVRDLYGSNVGSLIVKSRTT